MRQTFDPNKTVILTSKEDDCTKIYNWLSHLWSPIHSLPSTSSDEETFCGKASGSRFASTLSWSCTRATRISMG
jgi:hypothetical protein